MIKLLELLGVNSISEFYYINKRIAEITGLVGAVVLAVEGVLLDMKLLCVSSFTLFYVLCLFPDYKNKSNLASTMHYVFAGIFFIILVIVAGLSSVIIPTILTAYFYFKHKQKDVHLLVLEVSLIINTQILILW